MEFTQLITITVGAMLGAVFGGAVRWGGTLRERRITQTIALHAEFHAPAFNEIRIRAHDALTRLARPLPEAYAVAEGEDKKAIYSILTYFERVALLRRSGVLEESLLKRFMRQYAQWWRPLLCGEGEARDDPEWGETIREIDRLFLRLGGR